MQTPLAETWAKQQERALRNWLLDRLWAADALQRPDADLRACW